MLEKQWMTIDGAPVDLLPAFKAELELGTREIHVGTDSQQYGKHTEFVTIVAIMNPGKGGRVLFARERTPRIQSLRERLLKEVWMSVNIALELNSFMDDASAMTVHVDANPNVKFKSSAYVKELASMVMSQGFKAVLKPDAWCASHAADHVVKGKIVTASYGRHNRRARA